MKSVLLLGSSIFEQWTQASNLLPDCNIVNRAIGGTTTSDWVQHLPTVLSAEAPDAIMLYCGSNDLNDKVTQESILANLREIRRLIHKKRPKTKFAYFGIIKAPQKVGKWDEIDQLNRLINSALEADDLYVESNAVFFCDGAPIAKFYVEDGLHLTDEAYSQLSDYVAPIVDSWLFNQG